MSSWNTLRHACKLTGLRSFLGNLAFSAALVTWQFYFEAECKPKEDFQFLGKWPEGLLCIDKNCCSAVSRMIGEDPEGGVEGRPFQILLGNFLATFRILSNFFVSSQLLATFRKSSTFLVPFGLF